MRSASGQRAVRMVPRSTIGLAIRTSLHVDTHCRAPRMHAALCSLLHGRAPRCTIHNWIYDMTMGRWTCLAAGLCGAHDACAVHSRAQAVGRLLV